MVDTLYSIVKDPTNIAIITYNRLYVNVSVVG